MNDTTGTCPIVDSDELIDFALGRLDSVRAATLGDHVGACTECSARLEGLADLRDDIASVKSRPARSSLATIPPALEDAMLQAEHRMKKQAAWKTLSPIKTISIALAAGLALALIGLAILYSQDDPMPSTSAPAHLGVASTVTQASPSEPTHLELSFGGTIDLTPTTELTILRDEATTGEVSLSSGVAQFEVSSLPPGGSFRVTTTDATIKVVGTKFTVDKTFATETKVVVQEGTVEIHPHGKGRPVIVVEAGDDASVPSLGAYLDDTKAKGFAAMHSGLLAEAEAHFLSYLETSTGDDIGEVQLALAKTLVDLGKYQHAEQLYLSMKPQAVEPLELQNILAFLAMQQSAKGDEEGTHQIWKDYLDKFPDGVFKDQALEAIGSSSVDQAP